MKIQKITSQNRRDFTAIYECESCGVTRPGSGYDDANFHENVIPNMICDSCDATSGTVTSSPTVPAGVAL